MYLTACQGSLAAEDWSFQKNLREKSIEKMKNITSPSVEEALRYMIIHICCTLTLQRTDDFDLMNFAEEMSNEVSDR